MHNDPHSITPPAPLLTVVGELNADLILNRVNALPELGKERIARGMTLTLGSSSAILASNASALGLSTGFIGRIGDDSFGRYVVECLQARGVDTRNVMETPGVATGLTVIYTFGDDRGSMTYPGAMERLTFADLPWPYILKSKHLHLSSFFLQPGMQDGCREMFRRAKAAGLSTSFDTNWDPDERWDGGVLDVLDDVDIFLPNDDEARRISGEEDLDSALAVLCEHAGTVVATCGAGGVVARSREQTYSLPSFQVESVDAVGAGDTFNAGFLFRFIHGHDLDECLRFGSLAGAFSTLASGGTAAFDDIEAFIRFARQHEMLLPDDPFATEVQMPGS